MTLLEKLKYKVEISKNDFVLSPYDVTIEQYYRAENDIKILLKQKKELNELEITIAKEWYFELQEWYSKQVNQVIYNKNLRDYEYILVRERKIIALKKVVETLNELRSDLIYMSSEKLKSLAQILTELKIPKRVSIKDQIWSIEKEIKGYETAIKLKQKKEVITEKENWVKMVTIASKINKYRIDPKQTTLAEWVEIIKQLQNTENERNKTDI